MQEIIDNNFDRLPTRQSYGILDVLPASPAKKNSIEVKMTADLIQQPQIWQLLMEASSDRLAAVAFSPYENHSMIFEELAYKSGDGELRGLENTVYNNSLLLADFSKVTLLYMQHIQECISVTGTSWEQCGSKPYPGVGPGYLFGNTG